MINYSNLSNQQVSLRPIKKPLKFDTFWYYFSSIRSKKRCLSNSLPLLASWFNQLQKGQATKPYQLLKVETCQSTNNHKMKFQNHAGSRNQRVHHNNPFIINDVTFCVTLRWLLVGSITLTIVLAYHGSLLNYLLGAIPIYFGQRYLPKKMQSQRDKTEQTLSRIYDSTLPELFQWKTMILYEEFRKKGLVQWPK